MKNIEVYEGVEERDERIALGKRYNENVAIGLSNQFLDDRIKALEKEIIACKEAKAINEHVNTRGWHFFDISDEITDYGENYVPFVGTLEELEKIVPDYSERYGVEDA